MGLFKTIPRTRDLEIENGNVQVINSGYSPIYVGLLGGKSLFSHIYNVKLSGKVTAESKPNNDKSSNGVYVGGIAGQIDSTDIENVHVNANLTGISNNYGASVGGLGGVIRSPLYYSSGYHTANSSFTGNINAHSKFIDFGDNTPANYSTIAGGMFGENSFQRVKRSYTKAKINATSNTGSAYAGGINGYTYHGWLENVYSESEINAHSSLAKKPDYDIENIASAGGLNGLLSTDQNYSHYFNNVYASGKLSATSSYKTFTGGLAGRWLWNGVDDPEQDKNRLVNIYSQDKNITAFFNKDLADTNRTIGQDSEKRYSDSVKNTNELKDRATFEGWDFDNIWYMNEGSMPKLRAFATPLAVAPTTPTLNAPTDKAQAGVKAPDLSKPYDGKKIENVEALKQLDGWKDNFDATGLTNGDTVENIFQPNTLTIDETRGDWKGAKDVKEGGYELYPTGTLKDEYQQKYIIEWNKGVLTINPAKLTITAMNNIKPEGENNPDVSRIGVVVTGLVNGEQISDVNLSYSDDKKWQGDISIIRVGEPVFSNGKASNYEITKNHGKLLTVQKEYDVKNITDKKPEDVITILRQLGAVKDDGTIDISEIEDRALLAHAVYGNGVDENTNSPKRWYEIWEVKHKGSNIITKEMKELGFDPSKENDGNTYTKLYELIDSKDTYIGTQYQVEIIKYGLGTPEYRLVTPKEYDDLVKLYGKDKVYKKKEFKDGTYSDTEPNGLNIGVYRNTNSNKNFIVFRGTDSMNAYDFFGKDGFEDSDGETNARQVDGKLPPQYKEAKNFVKTLITNNPNTNYEIVGHSLGGGLASYASISQDKPINTTVFNQALLHFNNIPNINNRKPSKPIFDGRELYDYAKTFNQVHSFVFDDDIVSNGDKATLTHIGNVEGIRLLPNKINTDWFDKKIEAYENRVADHQMTHVRKTIYLADTMAKNNEMLANCQSYDCQVLRQNRWTPSSSNLEKIDNKRANTINKLTNEQNQVHQQISELEKQGKNSERKQRDLDKINQKLDKAVQAEVKSNNITVIRGNDIFSVKKNNGWTFQKGDIINTGNKKATIYFPDGSWVELDKDTSIEITIEYNPSVQLNKPIASYIALIKGKILKEGTKQ